MTWKFKLTAIGDFSALITEQVLCKFGDTGHITLKHPESSESKPCKNL